jgi:hypothetical protein
MWRLEMQSPECLHLAEPQIPVKHSPLTRVNAQIYEVAMCEIPAPWFIYDHHRDQRFVPQLTGSASVPRARCISPRLSLRPWPLLELLLLHLRLLRLLHRLLRDPQGLQDLRDRHTLRPLLQAMGSLTAFTRL